ncbi:retrovirus-related pol polyprotein [Moniliophthora roreri]|nr:retrovirus-related pol polyprotein [Moniliophthora roreri]
MSIRVEYLQLWAPALPVNLEDLSIALSGFPIASGIITHSLFLSLTLSFPSPPPLPPPRPSTSMSEVKATWEAGQNDIQHFTTLKPLVNHDNYVYWSSLMEKSLRLTDVYDVVVDGIPKPSDPKSIEFANWVKKDNHAQVYLMQCIDESLIVQVGSLSSSHEIWLALKQVGEQKGSGMLMYWMHRLVTPLSSGDVEKHLKLFQECLSMLKKLDFDISSYLEAALLLTTLPANPKDS